MASLVTRAAFRLIPRTAVISAARSSGGGGGFYGGVDPQKGKVEDDKMTMPDGLGHSVGAERYEKLAKAAGNDDPFEMNVITRAKGTKDDPTLIPSLYDTRQVGCICEEESISIQWMYLNRGHPMRCQCGYWFKLVDAKVPEFVEHTGHH